MSCIVDKWVNELPSITGQDAYEVSRYVKLDYWSEIKKSYEEFINEALASNEISLCLVVGEWGLGKTSSFRSFVMPFLEKNNCVGVMIKARDYIDYFNKLSDAMLLIAEKAIRALLLVINKVMKLGISETADTDELLNQIISSFGGKKIFVFIDEFESVIDEEFELSSRIIEGIAALVNGEYEPLSKRGIHKGRLHLILSMTPQALSRFKTEIRFQETKGRMLRRIKKTIELRPLTRSECYNLLLGYLRYIYNGMLPSILPFPTLSMLESIIYAGRRNPGYMILILNMLISSLLDDKCPESKIKRANISDLEIALKSPISWESTRETISIETDYIDNLATLVAGDIESQRTRDLVKSVIKTLALSPFPLSIGEIASLIQEKEMGEIDTALNIIDVKLSGIYRAPILQFYSVSKEIAIAKINELVSEDDFGSLIRDKLSSLLDYITRYRYSSGRIVEEVVVPSESYINYFVREVSESTGVKEEYLIKIFRKLLTLQRNEKLYRFNRDIHQNVYPPPCPICRAVKEKDEAQLIWRQTLRDVSEGEVNEIDLGLAMVPLLIPYFYFNENDYLERNVIRKKLNYGQTLIDFKFIALGILDKRKLQPEYFKEKFKELLNNVPIVFIFTKTDLERYARELQESLREEWYLKIIPIGTIDIAKMLGLRRLKKRNLSLFESEIREIIKLVQDRYHIDEDLLKRIIPESEHSGIIVSRPTWDPRLSITDIPRVYDYYLVHPKAIIRSKDVFKWVENNIKRFIFFGLRSRDIPCGIDIESPDRLLNLENYLIRNNFLREVARGLMINNSEIEQRIIKFAEKKGSFNINELKSVFIFESLEEIEKNVLKDIYLEILKRKGYIEEIDRKAGEYRYIKLDEKESIARKLITAAEKEINSRALDFIKIANIIVTKERGYRYIDLRDFIRTLKSILESAYSVRDEIDKRRLFSAIIRLKESVFNLYLRIIEAAYVELKKIIGNATNMVREIKRSTENISTILNLVNIDISPYQILEISHLDEKIREIYAILNHEYSEKEIEEILNHIKRASDENPFDFKKLNARELKNLDKAYFFNIKFYKIKKIADEIRDILIKLNEGFQRIKIIEDLPKEFDNVQREIQRYLEKVFGEPVEARYNVSFKDILGRVSIGQKISFTEFINLLNIIAQRKEDLINSLNGMKSELKTIWNYISKARNNINDLEEVLRNAQKGNIEIDKKLMTLRDKLSSFREIEKEFRDLVNRNVNYTDLLLKLKNFKRVTIELASEEDYLQNKLNEFHVRDKAISSKISKARDYLDKLIRIRSLVRDKISRDEIESISNKINDMSKTHLEGRDFISIEKELDSIIERLHSLIEPYLNPITEEFLKMLFDTKINRLSLREAVRIIAVKLSKDEKEVLRTITRKLEDLLKEDRIDIVIEKK